MSVYDDEKPRGLGQESEDAPDFVEPDESSVNNPLSSDELLEKESDAPNKTDENASEAAQKEVADLDDPYDVVGLGFRDEEKKKGRGPKFWQKLSPKRKAAFSGTIIGLLLTGGVGAVWVVPQVGVLQIMHFSETLKSITKPHEAKKTTSLTRLYQSMRDPKNGVGKSRLSFLQYVNHDKLIDSMQKRGIYFTTESRGGRLRTVSIDPSKITEFSGKNAEQVKNILSERYGVQATAILGADGGNMRFNLKNAPLRVQEAFARDMVSLSGKGRLGSYLEMRHWRAYLGTPSLFHPFARLDAKLEGKINLVLDNWEKKRSEKLRSKLESAKKSWATLQEKYGGAAFKLGAALSLSGYACMVVSVAKSVHQLNMQNYTMPGAQSGIDGAAMGDQYKASFTKDDPGVNGLSTDATVANFYDENGLTPFDSNSFRSLNGLAPMGTSKPYEQEYQSEYKLIQDGFNSVSVVEEAADIIMKAPGMDLVCSDVGQWASLVGGLALIAFSAPVAGPGGYLALQAVKMGAQFAIFGKAVEIAINLFAQKTPDIIPHKGPSGGDFDALGMEKAANMIAAARGGSQLSHADTVGVYKMTSDFEDLKKSNQSMYARVFSPTNYQSVTAKVIDQISPNPIRNAQKISNSVASLGTTLTQLPSRVFNKKAYAQAALGTGSNMGLVESQPEMDAIEDRTNNGDEVADYFAKQNAEYMAKYDARVKVCYGNELMTTTDQVEGNTVTYLDAKHIQIVDIGSTEYRNADCANMSDPMWVKISAYINDQSTIEAESCGSANYESSCTRLGYGMGTMGQPTVSAPASEIKSMADLMVNTDTMSCPSGTEDGGVYETQSKLLDRQNLKTYKIRLCKIKEIPSYSQYDVGKNAQGYSLVNVIVAQKYLEMAKWAQEQAKAKNLKPFTAGYTFRSPALQKAIQGPNAAPTGLSAHEMGFAVDISSISGKNITTATCSNRSLPTRGYDYWKILNGSPSAPGAQQFGFYQIATEPWHFDARPTSCKDPSPA